MQVSINTNRTTATVNTDKRSVLVNQSTVSQIRMRDILDVDLTNLEDGSTLIYNISNEKFEATVDLDKQHINGGHF